MECSGEIHAKARWKPNRTNARTQSSVSGVSAPGEASLSVTLQPSLGRGLCVVTYPAVLPTVEGNSGMDMPILLLQALSSPVWERKETQFSEASGRMDTKASMQTRKEPGKTALRDVSPQGPTSMRPCKTPLSSPTVLWA